MTQRQFARALRRLGGRESAKSQRRAAQAFERLTHDDWVDLALQHGPSIVRQERRSALVAGACCVCWFVGALAYIAIRFWNPALTAALKSNLQMLYQLPGMVVAALFLMRTPLAPLLTRLDDIRLVPLWLEALSPLKTEQRALLVDRLARHLPRYRQTVGAPLPAAAPAVLRREVERFSQKGFPVEEVEFVIAALICLDEDRTQGTPVDASTRASLERLATFGDGRVEVAAEDAIQRLGGRS